MGAWVLINDRWYKKPKDKAKVEAAVLLAERWILARLRNQRFFGLDEVNAAVIVVLIMRFRRRGCFLGGFSSVNYEISTGTLGQSLLVDCVALLLFQNSRSVRQ